ncbi:hypothetical protein OSC03_18685 [Morganella morganii]|uniref:tail fiber/spike domain-containing protein n=1 Tax=Morganella morganii TaxID=582 RepID=UPI00287528C9|nr:hypothetical protein [Morganella morganii]MDS0909039.1 hypothetical protein [Morganella morganii]
MATIPTQNAVPSEAPRDLKFNSGKIDEFVTSLEHEYKDRFGRCHMTIEGMRWIFEQLMERFKVDINQAIIAAGYIPMDSFQQGAEITKRNEILRDETTGEYYRWDGDLPKSVTAGSTPESAGGVGMGSWVSVGDAALRTMLASTTGTGLIGMPAGGALADTIHTVSVEQWSHLVGVDNDWSLAIQAAIDYMSAAGGGIVELGVGEYRAMLVQKPRVLLKGQGMLLTKIKAPDGWNARAVIESWNYDYAVSVGSGSPDPGCYCAGYMDLTVDGNLQNWSGTASENSGYGILHLGACMVFRNVQVIYSPGINLRTIDWGVNREKYAAVMPGWSWPIIGVLDNIRLKMCGNDNWVCEAQDYFATNIEIHDAGYPFPSSDDVRSFLYPTQRVTNFLLLRSIDIGFLHSYGCWGGYGMVAGPDTTTFFIRVKWDSIILESCNQALWFKKSSYLQGSKLDIHECSGHESVPLHGDFVKAPIGVFESTYRPSYINTVVINQLTPEYNGIQALVSGQFIKMNITANRSDTIGANNSGTGIWLTGSYNELDVTAKGFLGTNDSEGNPSSAIVASSGVGNTVDCNIGFSRNGVRLLAQGVITAGELKTILASVDTPFTGFSALSVAERRRVSLLPGNSGGNRLNVFSGALDLTDTSVKTISIPVNIAYRPTASELSFNMEIQTTGGSSVYPNLKFISYNETSSSATSLVFSYQSISSSPMGVRLAIRLG